MISKIEKIKTSIDTFNDAEFFSFGEEKNEVIIKSLNDGSLWKINYMEQEEEIIFDTEKAEKIKDGEPSDKEIYKENVSSLMSSLKSVFSEDFEAAIEQVREHLKVIPKEIPVFEEAETEEEYAFEGEHFASLGEKMKSYYEAKKDFASLGYMFEGEEIKRDKLFNPLTLIDALKAKTQASDSFIENVQLIVSFKEKLEGIFENKEMANYVATKIDLKNPKISIPKTLVVAKKQFEESFNVVDKQKEILTAFNETFEGSNIQTFMEGGGTISGGQPVPFVYNQTPAMPKFRYLKFRTGAFNEEDLNVLQKELQSVMGRYSELSSDELKIVNEMSTRVTYMQMTGQINDQLVVSMIEGFNKTFKKSDDYDNAHLQLGFKGASERDARNFNRGTSNVPVK